MNARLLYFTLESDTSGFKARITVATTQPSALTSILSAKQGGMHTNVYVVGLTRLGNAGLVFIEFSTDLSHTPDN